MGVQTFAKSTIGPQKCDFYFHFLLLEIVLGLRKEERRSKKLKGKRKIKIERKEERDKKTHKEFFLHLLYT